MKRGVTHDTGGVVTKIDHLQPWFDGRFAIWRILFQPRKYSGRAAVCNGAVTDPMGPIKHG